MGAQQPDQQRTAATAHIHQMAALGPRKCIQQGPTGAAGDVTHGAIKDGGPFRMLLIPIKQRIAKALAEGRLPGADAVEEIVPGQVVLIAHEAGEGAHRGGMVGPQ